MNLCIPSWSCPGYMSILARMHLACHLHASIALLCGFWSIPNCRVTWANAAGQELSYLGDSRSNHCLANPHPCSHPNCTDSSNIHHTCWKCFVDKCLKLGGTEVMKHPKNPCVRNCRALLCCNIPVCHI